jgi:hypothetical protein
MITEPGLKVQLFVGHYTSYVMGAAMAHEIGHLLLQSEAHSPSGIMQLSWSRADLLDATRGQLRFTPDQAATMRKEVLRRVGMKTTGSLIAWH